MTALTAARVARKRQLGYGLKRRIAALDPEEDHEEVARLTLEVLSGDPFAVHAGLLIGFSRQVAGAHRAQRDGSRLREWSASTTGSRSPTSVGSRVGPGDWGDRSSSH